MSDKPNDSFTVPNGGAIAGKNRMVGLEDQDKICDDGLHTLKQVEDAALKADKTVNKMEELNYSPGIVSRLRCHYLNLALPEPESRQKQRHPGHNLRRASSLNTLHDLNEITDNIGPQQIEEDVLRSDNSGKSSVDLPITQSMGPRNLSRRKDSLRCAYSVEVLYEKSSWNSATTSTSFDSTRTETESMASSCDASAAQSQKARDPSMTSKSPTFIFEDAERPPTDLVKQRLKMFEATANQNSASSPRAFKKEPFGGKLPGKLTAKTFSDAAGLISSIIERKMTVTTITNGADSGVESPLSELSRKFSKLSIDDCEDKHGEDASVDPGKNDEGVKNYLVTTGGDYGLSACGSSSDVSSEDRDSNTQSPFKKALNKIMKATATPPAVTTASVSSTASSITVVSNHVGEGCGGSSTSIDHHFGVNNFSFGALRKKYVQYSTVDENVSTDLTTPTRMETPDHVEQNSGIFRRNSDGVFDSNLSGLVLIGGQALETSTDTDDDDGSLSTPSVCDVEFENANVLINGKSSLRSSCKQTSFRVQFNDHLTSTFEYPSEAALRADNCCCCTDIDKFNKTLQETELHSPDHVGILNEIRELPLPNVGSSESYGPRLTAPEIYKSAKAPNDNTLLPGETRASNRDIIAHNSATAIVDGYGDNQMNQMEIDGVDGECGRLVDIMGDSLLKPANDDLDAVFGDGMRKTI